uniref:CSLF3-cellulose synthase-like family F n=1 Tax=Arundo donax TaxID=35708 RepID=A0A0A9DSD1_ARUDO
MIHTLNRMPSAACLFCTTDHIPLYTIALPMATPIAMMLENSTTVGGISMGTHRISYISAYLSSSLSSSAAACCFEVTLNWMPLPVRGFTTMCSTAVGYALMEAIMKNCSLRHQSVHVIPAHFISKMPMV